MIGYNIVRRAVCTIFQPSTTVIYRLHIKRNLIPTAHRQLCSGKQEKGGQEQCHSPSSVKNPKPLQPPPEGLCCGSGCANCVWFVYAEELISLYQDGGTAALKSLDQVPDPNIREFLKMELKMKMKI